jgi:hypothetical protein
MLYAAARAAASGDHVSRRKKFGECPFDARGAEEESDYFRRGGNIAPAMHH